MKLSDTPVTVGRLVVAVTVCAGALVARPAMTDARQAPAGGAEAQRPSSAASDANDGIPIRSEVVLKACGGCHTVDDRRQMSRISFQRRTPEGWEAAIRRMVALNNLRIEPDTARIVLAYLSSHHGLAPDEARPAAFEVERRLVDVKYSGDRDAEDTCTKCHSIGRIMAQRRTAPEWQLLLALHRGLYTQVDFQVFRRAVGPGARPPAERAADHFSQAFPLRTREWSSWVATMRSPQLTGTWALSGWEPGKGPIFGQVSIGVVADSALQQADAAEFATQTSYVYGWTGQRVTRSGRATVYTGYQWRGRTSSGGEASEVLREVMWVDREWRSISGRWFGGGYDELGVDVRLERVGGTNPHVLGADRTALVAGSRAQELTIYGANLSAAGPSAVDLGPGVSVTRIVSATSEAVKVVVDVAPDAPIGARDVVVAGASRPRSVTVYDTVDRIKVTPEWSMARIGGIVAPKMLAQFEARAFHRGPDGRIDTADDLDLGVVPATWGLEEYAARYQDDDIRFVGEIDAASGRFTPNVDGPNPARASNMNNIGDVWVVATYTATPDGAGAARPLKARAHLLVTVPLYMRWESVPNLPVPVP